MSKLNLQCLGPGSPCQLVAAKAAKGDRRQELVRGTSCGGGCGEPSLEDLRASNSFLTSFGSQVVNPTTHPKPRGPPTLWLTLPNPSPKTPNARCAVRIMTKQPPPRPLHTMTPPQPPSPGTSGSATPTATRPTPCPRPRTSPPCAPTP